MHSRLLLTIIGLSLASSMLMMTPFVGAFAYHGACFEKTHDYSKCNLIEPRLPPVGSVYSVNLFGGAFTIGEKHIKPVSIQLELNVAGVKTTGVEAVYLAIVKGDLNIGDEKYTLTRGSVIVMAGYVIIKSASDDGNEVLTAYSALKQSLPISKDERSASLGPAVYEKSIDINIVGKDLYIDNLGGNISRTG